MAALRRSIDTAFRLQLLQAHSKHFLGCREQADNMQDEGIAVSESALIRGMH